MQASYIGCQTQGLAAWLLRTRLHCPHPVGQLDEAVARELPVCVAVQMEGPVGLARSNACITANNPLRKPNNRLALLL